MRFHLLLPFLLMIEASVKLPVFTVSEDAIRPKEIGKVKAMSGTEIYEHEHNCGPMKWKLWKTKSDGEKDVDVMVGCNMMSTMRAAKGTGDSKGKSCTTSVTCDTEPCTQGLGLDGEDGQKKYVAQLDPQCFVTSIDGAHRHRWGNYEKTISALAAVSPKGAVETLDNVFVNMPTADQATQNGLADVIDKFLAHSFFPSTSVVASKTPVKCNDGCKYGRVLKINYERKEKTMHFFLQPSKCDWVTICTDWKGAAGCSYQASVNVFLRNGFVSFDSKGTQVPIRLLRDTEDGKGIVRVDLSTLSGTAIGEVGTRDKVAITSMFRERVLGSANLGEEMLVIFSHADCLHPDFGLRAQTNEVSVIIEPSDDAVYEKKVDDDNKNNPEITKTDQDGDTSGVTIAPVTLPPPSTTTDFDVAGTATTTAEPPFSGQQNIGIIIAQFGEHLAEYEGRSTWAIFYGWLIGSFLAIVFMASIMYFCRRTFYNDWYRGIYKRYGCDASGTTGGVTGESFGETTTGGAMTIKTQMDSGSTSSASQMTSSMIGTTGGGTTGDNSIVTK